MFQSFDYSMSLSTLVGIYANELFCFNGDLVVTNVFIKTNVIFFFNGAISSDVLFYKLGTLSSSMQLSLRHYYLMSYCALLAQCHHYCHMVTSSNISSPPGILR